MGSKAWPWSKFKYWGFVHYECPDPKKLTLICCKSWNIHRRGCWKIRRDRLYRRRFLKRVSEAFFVTTNTHSWQQLASQGDFHFGRNKLGLHRLMKQMIYCNFGSAHLICAVISYQSHKTCRSANIACCYWTRVIVAFIQTPYFDRFFPQNNSKPLGTWIHSFNNISVGLWRSSSRSKRQNF